MERISLIATAALALTLLPTFAAEPTPEPPAPAQIKSETPHPHPKNEEAESLKKAVRALSPEQKQKLTENLKTWKQLNPEQKETLKQREALLRKQASEEVATVTAELPENQREAFLQRYQEERRKLQASLRQEMEARKKAGLSDLLQSLKQEMQVAPARPLEPPK